MITINADGETLISEYDGLGRPYALSRSLAIQGFSATPPTDAGPPVTDARPLEDREPYVFAATYNFMGKPSEVRLGNGLSQRTNYYGLDTPTAFGTSQFGRTRQICVAATAAGNCYDDTRPGGDDEHDAERGLQL